MRLSKHMGKTLKEDPRDAQALSHKLLLRGGYMRQVSSGVFIIMPFLQRVFNKISEMIRDEMMTNDYEEVLLPALQPKELWVESGRWEDAANIDETMFVFKDQRGSTFGLGSSHHEVIADLVRREITSYKQLPRKLYQTHAAFRNETRPRFGLMLSREFIMSDAYSFDTDEDSLNESYQVAVDSCNNICKNISLTYRCVEADNEDSSNKLIALSDSGEDTIVFCDTCEYAAMQEVAESKLQEYSQDTEEGEMEAVYGPGLIGVEPLAEFLKIPVWKTTKTLLFQADEKVVAVMVRGDCDVNEAKVKNYLKCNELILAPAGVIKDLTGADVGYAGPVGLPPEVIIIADHYTNNRINFECGANRTDYHTINVNYGRDLPLPTFGDFKLAKENHACPRCEKGVLKEARGIEVGHSVKTGTVFTEKMSCTYLDKEGSTKPVFMGSYGINLSRAVAAIVEQNHDDTGIIWPLSVAPFTVHLVVLNLENDEVRSEAEKLYKQLREEKIEVLFDDRDLRAGEKFGDADLIGLPVRLTLSKRTMKEGKLELKLRKKKESELLDFDVTLARIKELV